MLLRASLSPNSAVRCCGVVGFEAVPDARRCALCRRSDTGVAVWLTVGRSTQGSSASASSSDHLLLSSSSPALESHSSVPSESGLGMLGGDDDIVLGNSGALCVRLQLGESCSERSGRTVRTGVEMLSSSSAMLWWPATPLIVCSPKEPGGKRSRRAVTLGFAGGDSSNIVSMRGPRAPPDVLLVAPVRSESKSVSLWKSASSSSPDPKARTSLSDEPTNVEACSEGAIE
jgi:hypothetical protein